MRLLYRARCFLPAPLEVVEPLWLKFSQLGKSFDPPPGSWDEPEKAADGGVLRTIQRPRLRWTYHGTVLLAKPRVLSLEVQIKRGRAACSCLRVASSSPPRAPRPPGM